MADFHDSPWPLLEGWMADALATEPDVPDAMQIATVDAVGRPTLRTVLLKSFGPDDGLVFYTNLHSRKGRHLAADPRVAGLLHWKSRARQVIAEGPVHLVDPAEADAYWATRPRGSQLGAWASLQSEPLDERATLDQRLADVTARYEDGPVPRPPHWSGFRIAPERIEFWQGRSDRLHDRLVFTWDGGAWHRGNLYP